MHIGIVSVYVNDQERAKEFYTKKLGWEVRDDAPMGENMRWLSVAPSGAQTAIVLVKDFADWSPDRVGKDSGIALEVDDVFKSAEQLQAGGVEFETEPSVEFFGGWARFKDSEGNIFGMHSPAPVGATN